MHRLLQTVLEAIPVARESVSAEQQHLARALLPSFSADADRTSPVEMALLDYMRGEPIPGHLHEGVREFLLRRCCSTLAQAAE